MYIDCQSLCVHFYWLTFWRHACCFEKTQAVFWENLRLTDSGNISKYFPVVDWINIDDFEQVMLIGQVKSFIEAYLRLDKLMMEYWGWVFYLYFSHAGPSKDVKSVPLEWYKILEFHLRKSKIVLTALLGHETGNKIQFPGEKAWRCRSEVFTSGLNLEDCAWKFCSS